MCFLIAEGKISFVGTFLNAKSLRFREIPKKIKNHLNPCITDLNILIYS